MSGSGSTWVQGEWAWVPAPAPEPDPVVEGPVPDWLTRLRPEDRRRVVGLARERRPLVFLIDDRARWSLVVPRLPLAGFDPVDFQDVPDGDIRILAPADASPKELEHLLKCLRQARPPRAAACEKVGWTGVRLAAFARAVEPVASEIVPGPPVARKNS